MFRKRNMGSCIMLHMASVSLGEYVRNERERRKWTLRQLAEYSGVSFSMIAKIENGSVKDFSLDTIEKLAKGLNVPVLQLVSIALGLDNERTSQGLTPEQVTRANELEAKIMADPDKLAEVQRFIRFLQWEEDQAK